MRTESVKNIMPTTHSGFDMTAITQSGFCFNDEPRFVYQDDSPGTWIYQGLTTPAFTAFLTDARDQVAGLDDFLRPLFAEGIAQAFDSLSEMQETIEDDGVTPYCLDRILVEDSGLPAWSLELFSEFVRRADAAEFTGEITIKRERRYVSHSVYVAGVGELKAMSWPSPPNPMAAASFAIEYRPGPKHITPASYSHSPAIISMPHAIWNASYCGMRIAEAGNKPAKVIPFQHQDRPYVVTGMEYQRQNAQGDGWELCRLDEWDGITYHYGSLRRAWDIGSKERGDQRGLLVKVGDQECVLHRYARFVDDHYSGQATSEALTTANDTDDSSFLDCDDEDEAEQEGA